MQKSYYILHLFKVNAISTKGDLETIRLAVHYMDKDDFYFSSMLQTYLFHVFVAKSFLKCPTEVLKFVWEFPTPN